MPAPPLTHHEILELVGPFARRGRHVDLAATDRIERRVVFKAISHEPTASLPALREGLALESYGTGTCVLTRVLMLPNGLEARVLAMGSEPAALLAFIDAVSPQQQIESHPDYLVVRSYEVGPRMPQMVLTQGVAQVAGLRLTLTLSSVRGVAADLALLPLTPEPLDLPEDLLAVLGWDWARLIPTPEGWRSKLRLRGNPVKRSRNATAALTRAGAHLAATLAAAPGAFHDRWQAARWGVTVRRGIPALTFVALVAIIVCLPHFNTAEGSEAWVLMFQVPTALIALSFCLQELPQYEIPPIPRRSGAPTWQRGAVAAPGRTSAHPPGGSRLTP